MGYIFFGSIWIIMATFMGLEGVLEGADILAILIVNFFGAGGVIAVLVGLKIVIRDTLTQIKGEECFGKILKVYAYKSVSSRSSRKTIVYKADIAVYISSSEKVEMVTEEIGIDSTKFSKGDFVKVKTYKGDQNIGKKVDKNQIPIYILDILNAVSEQNDIANSCSSFEDKYKISDKIELYGEREQIRIIRSIVNEYRISLKEATDALDDYLKNTHKSN